MQTVRNIAEELGVVWIIDRAITFHTVLPGVPSLWSVPVEYDARLQTAGGYCHYEPLRITMHPALRGLKAKPGEHAAVFLHELAHAMAWQVYGPAGRGHGAHWWEMMHQLGQIPRRTHAIAACKKATDSTDLTVDDLGL